VACGGSRKETCEEAMVGEDAVRCLMRIREDREVRAVIRFGAMVVLPAVLVLGCATGRLSDEQADDIRVAKTARVLVDTYDDELLGILAELTTELVENHWGLKLLPSDAPYAGVTIIVRGSGDLGYNKYVNRKAREEVYVVASGTVQGSVIVKPLGEKGLRRDFQGVRGAPEELSFPEGIRWNVVGWYGLLAERGSFMPVIYGLTGELYGPEVMLAAMSDWPLAAEHGMELYLSTTGQAAALVDALLRRENRSEGQNALLESAASALSRRGDTVGLHGLVTGLGDSAPGVRKNAASALWRVVDKTIAIQKEPRPLFGKKLDPKWVDAVLGLEAILVDSLEGADPEVKEILTYAVESLGRLRVASPR